MASETPEGEIARLIVHADETKFALCALVGQSRESQPLDLNFDPDTEVAFSVEGSRTAVHITGYYNMVDDEIPSDLEDGEVGDEQAQFVFQDSDDEEDQKVDSKTAHYLLDQLADEDSDDDEEFEPNHDELNDSKDYHLNESQLDSEDSDNDEDVTNEQLLKQIEVIKRQQVQKQQQPKKQQKQPQQQQKKRKHEEVSSPPQKKQKTEASPQKNNKRKRNKKQNK